jgi:hypothetical protein
MEKTVQKIGTIRGTFKYPPARACWFNGERLFVFSGDSEAVPLARTSGTFVSTLR